MWRYQFCKISQDLGLLWNARITSSGRVLYNACQFRCLLRETLHGQVVLGKGMLTITEDPVHKRRPKTFWSCLSTVYSKPTSPGNVTYPVMAGRTFTPEGFACGSLARNYPGTKNPATRSSTTCTTGSTWCRPGSVQVAV